MLFIIFLLFQGCLATSTNGTITSPGYPGFYSVNLNREWLINAPSDATEILINIQDQDIHQTIGFPCDDYLKVEELRSNFILYNQCGTGSVKRLTARGNVVKISFISDEIGTGRGFNLTWSVSKYTARNTVVTNAKIDASTDSIYQSLKFSTKNTHSLLEVFTTKSVSKSGKDTSAIKIMKYTNLARVGNLYITLPRNLKKSTLLAKKMSTHNTLTSVNRLLTTFQRSIVLLSTAYEPYRTTADKNEFESVTISSMNYKLSSSSASYKQATQSPTGNTVLTEKETLASGQHTAKSSDFMSQKNFKRYTIPKTTNEGDVWRDAQLKYTTLSKLHTTFDDHETHSIPSDGVIATSTTSENTNLDSNYKTHPTKTFDEVDERTDDKTSIETRESTYLNTTIPNFSVNNASHSLGFSFILMCVLGTFVVLMCILVLIILVQQNKIKRLKHASRVNCLNEDGGYKTITWVNNQRKERQTYSTLLKCQSHKSKFQTNADDDIYLSIGGDQTETKIKKSNPLEITSNKRDFVPQDLTELKDFHNYIDILPGNNSLCNKTTTFASRNVGSEPLFTENDESTINLTTEGTTPGSNSYLEIFDGIYKY